jgi:hypothetical protein
MRKGPSKAIAHIAFFKVHPAKEYLQYFSREAAKKDKEESSERILRVSGY